MDDETGLNVCGAKTRSGGTCMHAPTKGRKRCHYHGGANGTGAPRGEGQGLYVDGYNSIKAIEERQTVTTYENGVRDPDVRPMPATVDVRHRTDRAGQEIVAPEGEAEQLLWRAQLGRALGTMSPAFIDVALTRLIRTCNLQLPGFEVEPSDQMNAALAAIEAFKAKDELEAMMAIQAVCMWIASDNLLSALPKVAVRSNTPRLAQAAARMGKAFTDTVAALDKHRNGNHHHLHMNVTKSQVLVTTPGDKNRERG